MRSFVHARLALFLLLCASGPGLSTSLRRQVRAVDSPQISLSHKVVPTTASVQINGNGFEQVETVYLGCDPR